VIVLEAVVTVAVVGSVVVVATLVFDVYHLDLKEEAADS
jgi:hypothetical protein